MSEFTHAITEPDRIKATASVERAKLETSLSKHGLYVSAGIVLLLVVVSAIGFFNGDKEILRQCLTGVFAFMAGMGFARFMPKQQ